MQGSVFLLSMLPERTAGLYDGPGADPDRFRQIRLEAYSLYLKGRRCATIVAGVFGWTVFVRGLAPQ